MDKVVYAVIVAGGRGRRMGAGINKQFLKTE
jgi:2-C-methyl-D-erythritol 4-phosphate cytidylyltransferase